MLSLKALRVRLVQIIFLKKIYTPIYKKNDCIVTKVLIMAMSPGDGIMSDYFVMGKYSQNNLRTKGLPPMKLFCPFLSSGYKLLKLPTNMNLSEWLPIFVRFLKEEK